MVVLTSAQSAGTLRERFTADTTVSGLSARTLLDCALCRAA